MVRCAIWYHLYILKNVRKKRLKPATLLKLTLLYGCFSHFLNCTNGTKSHNASHNIQPGKTMFQPSREKCRPYREKSIDFHYIEITEAVSRKVSVKKVCLKILQNSQENTYVRVFRVSLETKFWRRCFALSFTKFLRTPFLTEHLSWLLLKSSKWIMYHGYISLICFAKFEWTSWYKQRMRKLIKKSNERNKNILGSFSFNFQMLRGCLYHLRTYVRLGTQWETFSL